MWSFQKEPEHKVPGGLILHTCYFLDHSQPKILLGAEGQGGGGGEFAEGTSHQFVLILVRKRMTSAMCLANPMGGYIGGRK